MVPNTGTAVIIIVAFLLPGFAVVLLQERTFKSADDPTELDRLLRIFWYSGWSYLLVACIAAIAAVCGLRRSDVVHFIHHHNTAVLVLVGAVLVVGPAVTIEEATRLWHSRPARRKALEWAHINPRHTEPTAWDFFMRQTRDVYVRVTFADGARVLGYYGSASFAAYAKDGRDLYLERTFTPDDAGWFGLEAVGNAGVWVKTADAVAVEFYTPQDVGQEQAEPATETSASTAAAGEARGSRGAEAEPNPAPPAASTEADRAEEGLIHE